MKPIRLAAAGFCLAMAAAAAAQAQPAASQQAPAASAARPGQGPGPGMGPGAGMGPGQGVGPGPGAGLGPAPGPRAGASAPRAARGRWGPQSTPGWSMMTPQERDQHRAQMQGARSYDECRKVADEHRALMEQRAQEHGVKMPAIRGDACRGLRN